MEKYDGIKMLIYKNVKFYDTVTKQFVKLDNTIKGKGITFENI